LVEPLLVLPDTSKIRACPLTTPSDRRPDVSILAHGDPVGNAGPGQV